LIAESGRDVDQSLSPDEAVAHGAALYAGWLRSGDSAPPRGIQVTDVNSHDLGVLAIEPGTGRQRRQLLIPRNTPLPAVGLGRFITQRAGQSSVRVRIIEGGDATGAHATPIGQCMVTGLPPDLPAGTRVNVTCNYSPGGRLTVGAALPGTGRHAQVRIERASGLSDAQYDYWRQRIEAGRWLDEPGLSPPEPESPAPDAGTSDDAMTA
jgi:molecular chaperone DnaK